MISNMSVPIIMLHHVSDKDSFKQLAPYNISIRKFIQLLNYLSDNDFVTGNFLEKNCLSSKKGKQKRVILTFDDCSKELLDFAIPELKSRGMTAVFFIPTANIGLTNSWDVEEGFQQIELMNAEDLKNLANQGFEIGSHAHHHVKLGQLNNKKELENEIVFSKSVLEKIINKTVQSFSYPYGSVPGNYRELMQQAGYKYATSIYHPVFSKYALRRFIYHNGDSNSTLSKKLSVIYKLYRTVKDPLRSYN